MAFSVTPASISIKVGQKYQLTVSPSSGGVKWGCTVCNVASVNGAGVVTGIAPGSAEVSARRGNVIILIAVTVTAVSVPPTPPTPPTVQLQLSSGVTVDEQWVFSTIGTAGAASNPIVSSDIIFGDGTTLHYAGAPPDGIPHTFPAAATYGLSLKVVTQAGLQATATLLAIVSPGTPPIIPPEPPPVPVPPVAVLSFVSGQYVGRPITFSTVGTFDSNGFVVSHVVNYGDTTVVTGTGLPPSTPTHVYGSAGTFIVSLTVTDNEGQVSTTSVPVVISIEPTVNQPPIASLIQTQGQFVGDVFQFSTSGSTDPDGTLVSGSFSPGSGPSQTWTGPPPAVLSNTYGTIGLFTASITVIDNGGLSTSKSLPVTVSTVPTMIGTHPRIWINDIPSDAGSRTIVATKINAGGTLRSEYEAVVAYLSANWATDFGGNAAFAAESYAFVYAMWDFIAPPSTIGSHTSKGEWGDRAVALALQYMAVNPTVGEAEQEPCGVVYDWVNDRLTSGNRVIFANWFKTADALTGSSDPIVVTEVSKREFIQVFANAINGDGVTFTGGGSVDTWAAAHVAAFSAKWRGTSGSTRLASAFSGDDGTSPIGISYDYGHMVGRHFNAEDAYRTAQGISRAVHYGGTSGVDDTRYLRYGPQNMLYRILPWAPASSGFPGGRQFRWDKSFYMTDGITVANTAETSRIVLNMVAAYNGVVPATAQLGQWLLDNRIGLSMSVVNYREYIAKFIYTLATPITGQSPITLGLATTKLFADGRFISRQDWTSPNASYLTFDALKFLRDGTDHSGYNPGAIQLFRNGPLLVNQGGVGSHDWGMGQFTGSTNIAVFVDRSVTHVSSLENDAGGARRALGPADMTGVGSLSEDAVADRRGKNGQALTDELRSFIADGTARFAHYMYADLTRAYESNQYKDVGSVEKITSQIRQMVYFPAINLSTDPDCVFVFDRFTISTADLPSGSILAEQHWHTSGEPIVTGAASATPGPSRGDGTPMAGANSTAPHTQGITTYAGGVPIVGAINSVNGSNGAVWVTPISPTVDIIKVWGPNALGINWTTDSHEFETSYGAMCSQSVFPTADIQQYDARGRVEFHPTVHALTNHFLTVIEGAPNSAATQTATAGGVTATMAYARFGNARWAAFPLASSVATTGTFLIRGTTPGSGKLVIAGLLPGAQRTLTPGANISIEGAGAGVAYNGSAALVGASGSIELDVTFSADGAGAANTVTIS